MTQRPDTVELYLEQIPPDRREAITAVWDAVRRGLPPGYEEGIQYGMLAWVVPHSRYPGGYHCDPSQAVPFVSLASQRRYMTLHLFGLYIDPVRTEAFIREATKRGMKLDMGKGCIRFKRLEEIDLDLVEWAVGLPVEEFLRLYQASIPSKKRE